jgi:cold shock protein
MRELRRSNEARPSPGTRIRGHVRIFAGSYGFIVYQDDCYRARNVYVHHTDIQKAGWRELNVGDAVEFDIEQDFRGVHAARVTVVEPAPLDS